MAKLYFLPRSMQKDQHWLLDAGWRLEAALLAAFVALLRWLPLRRAVSFASGLFRLVGPLTRTNTNVMRNLAVVHPAEDAEVIAGRARRAFGWVGTAVAEIVHIPDIRAREAECVEYEIHPEIEDVLRDPEAPAVMVTAHVGAWTLTNLLAGHCGFPCTIVYAPESNPYIRAQILALREALPVRLIERDGSMRELIRELGAGRKVGLAADVRLDGGDMVELFGHAMETNTVPARLALKKRCPLVPVRAVRLADHRFRVIAEAPIPHGDPELGVDARAAAMGASLAAVYERWIRETPEEWLCMARRWPKALEIEALERARQLPRTAP